MSDTLLNPALPYKVSMAKDTINKEAALIHLRSIFKFGNREFNKAILAKPTCKQKSSYQLITDLDDNGNPIEQLEYFTSFDSLTGKPIALKLLVTA